VGERPPAHEWVLAPEDRRRGRIERVAHVIDAHRNHRGPYTAAGSLIARIGRHAWTVAPDLVAAHRLTLLSVVPGLSRQIPVPPELEDAFAVSREGNPRAWTQRLAHGLSDFILGYVERVSRSRCSVSFENVDQADPLDREFIVVLLRRADPKRLSVKVCAPHLTDDALSRALQDAARVIPTEPGSVPTRRGPPELWRAWLGQRVSGRRAEWIVPDDLKAYLAGAATRPTPGGERDFLDDVLAHISASSRLALAAEYVRSDCTSSRLVAKHAYDRLPTTQRRELHRACAASLDDASEPALALGAIPFHHEQAAGDAGTLLSASKHCMFMAYYDAALDWARRGRRMLDPADRGKSYSEFTRNMLFSLLLLGRYDEVEASCPECRPASEDPALLAHAAYAMAILNARLYPPSRRDYEEARRWVEQSLACTARLPPSPTRTVNLAFCKNTMALVEMRKGRPDAAHRLLSEALDYLAREAPERYPAESTILLHNRARVHVARQEVSEAIGDLTTLLRHQPSDSEAHFDRGVLHQRSGRHEEALRDYDATIRWSPPYHEPHFNRAQAFAALGKREEALADYDRALVLAPDFLEARLNRACLLFERGQLDAARADVDHALRLAPANARALCLRGLLETKRGRLDAARESFTEAIAADRSLADAWANRATIAFKRGDREAALHDLTEALRLREDAAAFYNRGRVLEAEGRWREADDDYARALALARGDVRHILRHRRRCRQAIGRGGSSALRKRRRHRSETRP